MYKKAAIEKFRFPSPQGPLSVEDLWDLPLQSNKTGRANLDDIAKFLNKALKVSGEETSFVDNTRPPADSNTQVMFDIVLDVIKTKKEENEAARLASDRAAQKQKILGILSQKQDEKLASASIEELQAALAAL